MHFICQYANIVYIVWLQEDDKHSRVHSVTSATIIPFL